MVLKPHYSGILCHISSLPTEFGIGDFGPVSYSWIDRLSDSKQALWQVLPLGHSDSTGCPYATDSAFSVAEYFLSPDLLLKDFNLSESLFDSFRSKSFLSESRVNYSLVKKNKLAMLEIAFKNFRPDLNFEIFLSENQYWLSSYAVYRTFKETREPSWLDWPAFSEVELQLTEYEKQRVLFYKFSQYAVKIQLQRLKHYAHSKNVKLVGDLPIFVSYESADVWKEPNNFILNSQTHQLEFETGAAPDAFSDQGQKWGTPLYNWSWQEQDGFKWWKNRFRNLSHYFDIVRVDHFRGFCATWISSVHDSNAKNGKWITGPGEKLFSKLTETSEIIVEDLGFITDDVVALRDRFNFPGMCVLQFMLGDDLNPHKIKNYKYNSLACSGTHDCDTLMGWIDQLSSTDHNYIKHELDLSELNHWSLIFKLMQSESKFVVLQVQDLLALGSEARFNYPGTIDVKNWTWKLTEDQFLQIDWNKLKNTTEQSGRAKCF